MVGVQGQQARQGQCQMAGAGSVAVDSVMFSLQVRRQPAAAAPDTSVGVRGGGKFNGDPYMISSVLFMELTRDSRWP